MYEIQEVNEVEKLKLFLSKAKKEWSQETTYYTVEKEEQILATIGYQQVENYALLTTFVFSGTLEHQVILGIFEQVLQKIRSEEVEEVYLVTKENNGYELFSFFGFTVCEDVPEAVCKQKHYKQAKKLERNITLSTNLSTVQ